MFYTDIRGIFIMAEVTKTIENVDTLFSQIVVNGTVYNSENYVAPETETTTEESTEETDTEEQTDDTTEAEENEEVYAVDLNDVVHNIKDDTARNSVEDINKLIPSNASEINKLVTQNSINLISSNITELQSDLEAEVTARENADSALESDIEAETTARENADSTLQSNIEAEAIVRENADTAINSSITSINSSISTINFKIPNQASAQNQLADKDFVNSSIATNTANFLGTYTSMTDIEAIQNPTNNDYVFLATTDSAGNTQYDRYKYSADQDEWLFEYELNNSSFTAEQWATINSGLTQSSVESEISTALEDYVPNTRTVNGHALSSDVTVTKSDVGLGSVVNTGDSATPTSGGTDKFTTGGAYTELAKKTNLTVVAPAFSTSTAYAVGDYVTYNNLLYKCTTSHSAGAWSSAHFTAVTIGSEIVSSSSDVSNKMDKTNPVGTGSFSLNRRANTTVGSYSFTEGNGNTSSAVGSHAEGINSTASGNYSHAEGYTTEASAVGSHAEGSYTKASSDYQHVQGRYNVADSNGNYADIVGNGGSANSRKNISALDWSGNLHLKGDVYVGCNDDSTGGTILSSSKAIPVASMMLYAGSSAPSGWLLCRGQAVSRTTYADLFAVIGTTYGTGDGSTTFNLPDLREAVPVGVGTRASGVTEHDTYNLGTFKDDQFQGHEHNYQKHTGSAKANWNNSYNITNFSDTPTSAIVEKSGYGAPRYGTTTHGKQLGLNFIIKY